MTTTIARPRSRSRWVLAVLVALTVIWALALAAGTASAASIPRSQNSHPASASAARTLVRPQQDVSADQRLGSTLPQWEIVVATGVAANTGGRVASGVADHAYPIGPAAEKSTTVLNRVDAKGAPLAGYKGGRGFLNSQGRLPEAPGGTYREWEVNPYVKGVNRGAERHVTGSDGSAFFTSDHYESFMLVRGGAIG